MSLRAILEDKLWERFVNRPLPYLILMELGGKQLRNSNQITNYLIFVVLLLLTFTTLAIHQISVETSMNMRDCEMHVETAIKEAFASYEQTLLDKTSVEAPNNKQEISGSVLSNENNTEAPIGEYANSKFTIGESLPLPTLPTNIKSYTDYRAYGLWYTPHYRLQQSAYTDEYGLRRFNDDYIVAMGAFYSTDIGDRFKVTLDSGNEFTVILGDGKAPIDCDENNMYAPCFNYNGEKCANVLEFIIDKNVMSSEVYSYGSIDCIDKFSGNIVELVYLGRDTSADWSTYETE